MGRARQAMVSQFGLIAEVTNSKVLYMVKIVFKKILLTVIMALLGAASLGDCTISGFIYGGEA